MRKLILMAVLSVGAFASCQKTDIDDGILDGGTSKVDISFDGSECISDTRVAYDPSGDKANFKWHVGDKVSLIAHGVDGNNNLEFTAETGASSSNFTGNSNVWAGEKIVYSIFPYKTTPYVINGGENSTTATVVLSTADQVVKVGDTNTHDNSYMVAVAEGATLVSAEEHNIPSLMFKQVMSILKFNAHGVPAGETVTAIRMSAESNEFITSATVNLSSAAITEPTKAIEVSAIVTGASVGATTEINLALFPVNLADKSITIEVQTTDASETKRGYQVLKTGMDFVRNNIITVDFPLSFVLTTNDVTNIEGTEATFNGYASSTVVERGFVYSKDNATPTEGNGTMVVSSSGNCFGKFTHDITGLTANIQYSVRAYAKKAASSIDYGDVKTFTTITNPSESYSVAFNNIIINDRNLGTKVPVDGVAKNYTNETGKTDNNFSTFKGDYYTWANAETACPTGWRLPTEVELTAISAAMKYSDGKAYILGADDKRCYFPLSGYGTDGSRVYGAYWSGTTGRNMNVTTTTSHIDGFFASNRLSVRCVQSATQDKGVSVPVKLTAGGNEIIVNDRNVGTLVPTDGVAYNYTNNKEHADHQNATFKGDYYTWSADMVANTCPTGWRLPTYEELIDIAAVMVISDGKYYIEGADASRCYFPLSGYEGNGKDYVTGNYWSSKGWSTKSERMVLDKGNAVVAGKGIEHTFGLSVRCVKSATQDKGVSVPVKLGQILISDRNVGADVPTGGDAYNYTNKEGHDDHKNTKFKGGYYTWAEAQTACDATNGWRLPTKADLDAIKAAMIVSATREFYVEGTNGFCYFPVSGHMGWTTGTNGYYWSSTPYGAEETNAWRLNLFTSGAGSTSVNEGLTNLGFSVRCVKDVE